MRFIPLKENDYMRQLMKTQIIKKAKKAPKTPK